MKRKKTIFCHNSLTYKKETLDNLIDQSLQNQTEMSSINYNLFYKNFQNLNLKHNTHICDFQIDDILTTDLTTLKINSSKNLDNFKFIFEKILNLKDENLRKKKLVDFGNDICEKDQLFIFQEKFFSKIDSTLKKNDINPKDLEKIIEFKKLVNNNFSDYLETKNNFIFKIENITNIQIENFTVLPDIFETIEETENSKKFKPLTQISDLLETTPSLTLEKPLPIKIMTLEELFSSSKKIITPSLQKKQHKEDVSVEKFIPKTFQEKITEIPSPFEENFTFFDILIEFLLLS